MKASTLNVHVADLPQVKATLDEAGRRLREQESTIQRLIAQAAEYGRQVAELQAQLAGSRLASRVLGHTLARDFKVDL